MNSKQTDRRRFLKNSAALAGLAVGASAAALPAAAEPPLEKVDELHLYGERSHYVTDVRNGSINNPERRLKDEPVAFGLRTPLQDSVGMITPSSLHFTISHGFEPPDIDPKEHQLLIHGMVDRPLIFSVDEIKRLPFVTRFHFVECHGNSSPRGPGGDARVSRRTRRPRKRTDSPVAASGPEFCCPRLLKEAGVQKRRDLDHRGRRRRTETLEEHSRSERPWMTLWSPTVRTASPCARNKGFRYA